ncbi:MAG: A/G-specific adenine glycosylase [Chloroflexi bacterium]|nr:A/G-specific adenine glycosylase [Chloroflexota bacterium]
MLQQTPVGRVLPAFASFLRRFPTAGALARASLGDVLIAWGTLGYPRRARDLHRSAQIARGRIPTAVGALDALPGVGAYTAGAVACFSTGAAVAFADTNVRRVLGRVMLGRTATEREATEIDSAVMPARDAARWHHALMDLGATVCTSRPHCDVCPVFGACASKGVDTAPAPRRQAAFATSDRRVRGAIMREIRSSPRSIAWLSRTIGDRRVPRLAETLIQDALIVSDGPVLRLPT